MAKAKKQAKATAPYVRRLLEDEHVQEQLRTAASGLRAAYGRVRRQGGKAAEDKRLYANLRQAATSIRGAATAVQRPKPEPRRRLQKTAAAALAGGIALFVFKQQKAGPRGTPS
jgi:hypothetical protein